MENVEASQYIKHIDGIRAVAVILVVLYHLEIPPFTGGFIGVDIFIVVSGFLITRLIQKEINETASFSFIDFYLRRFRRIVPALAATLLASTIAAALLFSAAHHKIFGGALASAACFFSNVYFWSESGYFDNESQYKPLLHTWSLSVEEQFYIIWPPFVFLLRKLNKYVADQSWYLNVPFILVLFGSVVLNIHFQEQHQEALYYLMPFRVFEFCIGALMVHMISQCKQCVPNIFLEFLCITGQILAICPAVILTNKIVFPSYNAVLPCIGTALLIFAGDAEYASILIKNKLLVLIGLASYSLYLVHWPIIVFYSYYSGNNLTSTECFTLFMVSLCMATAMYISVERPCRKLNLKLLSKIHQCLLYVSVLLAFVFVGIHIYFTDGWRKNLLCLPCLLEYQNANASFSRFDRLYAIQKAGLLRLHSLKTFPPNLSDSTIGYDVYFGGAGYVPLKSEGWVHRQNDNHSANIVLIGDSFASSLQHGLHEILGKPYGFSIYHVERFFFVPFPSIVKSDQIWHGIKLAIQALSKTPDSALMIFSFWSRHMRNLFSSQMSTKLVALRSGNPDFDKLEMGLDSLRILIGNRSLIIIGSNPIPGDNKCLSLTRFGMNKDCGMKFTIDYSSDILSLNINKLFAKYAEHKKFTYFFNPYDVFCVKPRGFCIALNEHGLPLFGDKLHLSRIGSIHFVSSFRDKMLNILLQNRF